MGFSGAGGRVRSDVAATPAIASAAIAHAAASLADTRRRPNRMPPVPLALGSALVERVTMRAPVSASLNSRAVAQRSAGNFSSDLSTVTAICSGTLGRDRRMLRGVSVSTRAITACDVLPMCGGSPVSISYVTAPSE